MNLGNFRARVSGEIGLSNASGSTEQQLIDAWANDAVIQFLVETKCYVKQFSAELTEGDESYDLGSPALSLRDLYITSSGGAISMLEPVSSAEIIYRKRFPSGSAAAGYSLEGANLLQFSSPARDGDSLNGLYVPRPNAMTLSTHDPSNVIYGGIPSEFHETLVQYPLWKAAVWDDDLGSSMQGSRRMVLIGGAYQQAWEQGVQQAKMLLRKKAGSRLSAARPGGRSNRRFLPVSPGVDLGR